MPDYEKLRDQAVLQAAQGRRHDVRRPGRRPVLPDLRVFDLLYGGELSEVGNDTLKGYNVNSIALQVPTPT